MNIMRIRQCQCEREHHCIVFQIIPVFVPSGALLMYMASFQLMAPVWYLQVLYRLNHLRSYPDQGYIILSYFGYENCS